MADIVVAGYLGFANSGDEALLSIVLSEIRRRLPDKTVTVLSMHPRETERLYGVCARHRYSPAAVADEFSRAEVFVFGGGSLLQDATSRRSLLYYLWLLHSAKRHGLKTMLFANGVGPLLRESSRRDTARVLCEVDAITLRDEDSARLLCEIGVPKDKVTVTADTAFLLGDIPERTVSASAAGVPEGARYAIVSYRPWRRERGYYESAASFCRHLYEAHGIASLLVPMQYPRDLRAAERIASRVAREADIPVYIWRAPLSARDALGLLSGAELTVGMRLHTLIFSAVAGVPMMGVCYDGKVTSLCRQMGVPGVPVGAGAEELCRSADELLADRAAASVRVRERAAEMASRAELTVDILAGLFGDSGGK